MILRFAAVELRLFAPFFFRRFLAHVCHAEMSFRSWTLLLVVTQAVSQTLQWNWVGVSVDRVARLTSNTQGATTAGNNSTSYGTLNTPSATNWPGSRYERVAFAIDRCETFAQRTRSVHDRLQWRCLGLGRVTSSCILLPTFVSVGYCTAAGGGTTALLADLW